MKPHEIITEQFIKKLEAGVAPWQKPWVGGGAGAPKNLVSKKPYRGINKLILGCSGYHSPYWLTFKQCNELGGNIKRGEHGSQVVFWKLLNVPETETTEPTEKIIPLLRYYTVFNFEQCENLPEPEKIKAFLSEEEKLDAAEALIAGYVDRPETNFSGDRAFYSPLIDKITLPEKKWFKGLPEFYNTYFHELIHSTGRSTRLDRLEHDAHFGNEKYSKEELVEEIGACFLSNEVELLPQIFENSAAYLASWLSALKNDSKLIIYAAAAAEKAAEWVKGILPGKKESAGAGNGADVTTARLNN